MPSREIGEIIKKFGIEGWSSDGYRYDLSKAKNKAAEIEGKLQGDNPIIYNEPCVLKVYYNDNYSSNDFPSKFKSENNEGEVRRIEVPFYSAKSDPDAYFKPLDIAKIFKEYTGKKGERRYMVHACVYLGNRQICHARSNNRVEIDS